MAGFDFHRKPDFGSPDIGLGAQPCSRYTKLLVKIEKYIYIPGTKVFVCIVPYVLPGIHYLLLSPVIYLAFTTYCCLP